MAARDETSEDLEAIFVRSVRSPAEALIAANGRDLFRFFARRTESSDDAADLCGELFLVVWRKEESVPIDPVAARMWAFGIARNVLANHQRGSRRRRQLADRLEMTFVPEEDQSELRQTVSMALGMLGPLDREIVRLVHWEGFSQAEVAAIVGRKPATVRSRYARARRRLAGILLVDDGKPERGAGEVES